MKELQLQPRRYRLLYGLFGILVICIMLYYFSRTIVYFTTDRQFPINSFQRFPLSILIFPAEVFSFFFALYFSYVLLSSQKLPRPVSSLPRAASTPVAVLIPVYNEPPSIVERNLRACRNVRWAGGVHIYLLDDSDTDFDKKQMDLLARKYDSTVVRRKDRRGYKAGNINNAVKHHLTQHYFVILDSDQAPEPELLEKTMDFFSDATVAFVQTPQHFVDGTSLLERAATVGTNIFYRTQCLSKARDGALPFCGTNAVFRTAAFKEVGGLAYYTATEDIELGIRINEAGYRGVYVPTVLVHGYAPPDFKAYSSQQYRWANGNLAILRTSFLKILGGNFSFKYQVHMLFTVAWWLIGITTLLYIIVPILALLFGIGTHHTWVPDVFIFLIFFHVFFGIFLIYASLNQRVEGEKMRIRDAFLQYSLLVNSMFIYIRAAVNALLFKRFIGFVRTNKKGSSSSLWLIKWNLFLGAVCFGLSLYALYHAVVGSTHQQLRTFLPVSIWLFFYAFVLFSSILFVGRREDAH